MSEVETIVQNAIADVVALQETLVDMLRAEL